MPRSMRKYQVEKQNKSMFINDKYSRDGIHVTVFSNMTQAKNRVEKLKKIGIDAYAAQSFSSMRFLVILNKGVN